MKDKEIINELLQLCKFKYTLEEELCTEISFSEDELWGCTIRRNKQKEKILHLASRLSNLKKLDLKKARANIPEFITKNLEYLDISCNNLEEIPFWILEQPNLKFLNVGSNQLKKLPNLSHLPLKTLKIHKNIEISNIPYLNLSIEHFNMFLLPKITKIPEQVLEMQKLKIFAFGQTSMCECPPIYLLKNLKWLILTLNKFKSIPNKINELKNLEGLILAKNELEYIPESIGELKNLKVLSLYNNKLKHVPNSLFGLNLERINLSKNPLNKEQYEKYINLFGNPDFI